MLVVTGPIGVGKTSVLYEADALLVEASAHHATVELEDIARCWTEGADASRAALVQRNLAVLWSSFAEVGAERLLLSTLVERRGELDWIPDAVPGALVTVVRLQAPLAVVERRVRRREAGAPDGELAGARWWTEHFLQEQPEDHLVRTGGREVREIAREVLLRAGWLD